MSFFIDSFINFVRFGLKGPQSNEIPGEADHHSEYSSDDAPDISTNAHFGHLRYKKKPAFRKEVFKRKMETKEAKAGIENNNEGDSSSDLSSDVSTNFYFGNLQYRKATATSKEPVKSSVIESNLQHNYDPPKEQDKKMSKNVLPYISNKENIYTVAKGTGLSNSLFCPGLVDLITNTYYLCVLVESYKKRKVF